MSAPITDRSTTLRKLGLDPNDNEKTLKALCSLIRDEKDFKEFLKANPQESRYFIYQQMKRRLNAKFIVRPFWIMMDLPKPEQIQ